jgi:hypothetical protein
VCQPLWGAGLSLIFAGSLGDFAALGFAAQSLAVPVGALTLVANVFFAQYWLGESLGRRDICATLLVTLGVILTAVFGDKSVQCYSMDDLASLYLEPMFLGYLALIIPLMIILYILAHRADAVLEKYGPNSIQYRAWKRIHPFLYPVLSGFVGAQSVLFAKSIAEMTKLTARGHNQFSYLSVIIAISMLLTIFTQIHFYAKGLRNFDAIFVVPVFQSAFIVGAILVGATYFKEFSNFSTLQVIFFPTGIVIVILGVMLLAQRKMSTPPSSSSFPSADSKSCKENDESQMLFERRTARADVTPGVVQLFRDLKGSFGGRMSRRNSWSRGQKITDLAETTAGDREIAGKRNQIMNKGDMALETLDEETETFDDGKIGADPSMQQHATTMATLSSMYVGSVQEGGPLVR